MGRQDAVELVGNPTEEKIDLTGQVALVTGAGRGIGKAIACALRDNGAELAICARSKDEISAVAKELGAAHGHALAFGVDVTDRRAVEGMVAEIERELGPLELLVNNAAVHGPIAPFVTGDPDDWWQTMQVNVQGPLYCSRAVLPLMVERGHGRVVNVSSAAGFGVIPMISSYVVSKAALYRLTEALAAETRDRGVGVFAINPGLVRTTMSEDALSCGEPSIETLFGDWFDSGEDIPPEGAGELVVFLASGKADVLSGRCFGVGADPRDMVAREAQIEELDLYAMRLRVPDGLG